MQWKFIKPLLPYGLGGSHIFANTTSSHYLLHTMYIVLLLYICTLICKFDCHLHVSIFSIFALQIHIHTNKMQWKFTNSLLPYGLVARNIFTNESTPTAMLIWKGQMILKCLLCVFNFFQKMNENKLHGSKVEFIRSFFGKICSLTICFRTFGEAMGYWLQNSNERLKQTHKWFCH